MQLFDDLTRATYLTTFSVSLQVLPHDLQLFSVVSTRRELDI